MIRASLCLLAPGFLTSTNTSSLRLLGEMDAGRHPGEALSREHDWSKVKRDTVVIFREPPRTPHWVLTSIGMQGPGSRASWPHWLKTVSRVGAQVSQSQKDQCYLHSSPQVQ